MSPPNVCTNCHAAPPVVFLTSDSSFLCAACDLALHTSPTNPPRPQLRIPLPPPQTTDPPLPDLSDISSDLLLPPDLHPPSQPPTSLPHSLLSCLPPTPSHTTPHPTSSNLATAYTTTPTTTSSTKSDLEALNSVLTNSNTTVTAGTTGDDAHATQDSFLPHTEVAYSSSCSSTPLARSREEMSSVATSSCNNEWIPHVADAAQQRLASMATAYVRQEARLLFESSRRGGRVGKEGGLFGEGRSLEQRRRERLEALKRYREKRANRKFGKRVRYACRKQLADSRPRVKGRFVGRGEGYKA